MPHELLGNLKLNLHINNTYVTRISVRNSSSNETRNLWRQGTKNSQVGIQAMNETKNLKFQNLAAFQILAFEIPRQLPYMNYMNSNKETGS